MKKLAPILLALAMLLTIAACSGPGAGASTPPSASPSPSQEVKVLRVGMECGYAPYNWTQSDDSNGAVPIKDSPDYAYGYDVMMAKFLADKLGYTLEVHKIDWETLPVAVQSGSVDCVIAGQSIAAERLETVDFTTPYYYASIVALTTKESPYAAAAGLSDLKGATCTSQLGTVWYDVCLPQIEQANILPAMESAPTMLVALDTGKCDLVVTDAPTAMAALMVYPDMVMLDFTGSGDNFQVSEEEINIGISVQKGNSALLDALNAALAELTVEDFERMMNEAIMVQPLAQ